MPKPFSRGYNEIRKKMNTSAKYTKCCNNCAFYYKDRSDKEEVCQNSQVLEYDMVYEDNRVFCCRWKPANEPTADTPIHPLFMKRGNKK